jgi:hypothetical protein
LNQIFHQVLTCGESGITPFDKLSAISLQLKKFTPMRQEMLDFWLLLKAESWKLEAIY